MAAFTSSLSGEDVGHELLLLCFGLLDKSGTGTFTTNRKNATTFFNRMIRLPQSCG